MSKTAELTNRALIFEDAKHTSNTNLKTNDYENKVMYLRRAGLYSFILPQPSFSQ